MSEARLSRVIPAEGGRARREPQRHESHRTTIRCQHHTRPTCIDPARAELPPPVDRRDDLDTRDHDLGLRDRDRGRRDARRNVTADRPATRSRRGTRDRDRPLRGRLGRSGPATPTARHARPARRHGGRLRAGRLRAGRLSARGPVAGPTLRPCGRLRCVRDVLGSRVGRFPPDGRRARSDRRREQQADAGDVGDRHRRTGTRRLPRPGADRADRDGRGRGALPGLRAVRERCSYPGSRGDPGGRGRRTGCSADPTGCASPSSTRCSAPSRRRSSCWSS